MSVVSLLGDAFRSQPRRTVSWTEGRVQGLLRRYAGREGSGTSTAYAGLIAPEDFLGVTSSPQNIMRIVGETGPLDEALLSRHFYDHGPELETPFLRVVPEMGDSTLRVVGHEGRHRSTALGNAGARRVPVVFELRDLDDNNWKRWTNSSIAPRKLSERREARIGGDLDTFSTDADAYNLIPITYENKRALLNLGTKNKTKNHITYALPPFMAAALLQALASRDDARA